jgi:Zn-dependent peptidase ImmA (M78 family)
MAVRKKFIERLTVTLLRETDQFRPPARLDVIGERIGVAIAESRQLPQGTRAAFDPDRWVIDVAPLPRAQTRFSLAHELGHAALDHGSSCSFEGEPTVVDVPLDLEEAETGLDHEAEADYFAGCLLVPRTWLRRSMEGYAAAELRELFEVSNSALLIAATDYRLLNRLRV